MKRSNRFLPLLSILLVLLASGYSGTVTAGEPEVRRDIEFARVGGRLLALDLYRPRHTDGPVPLIVWIHGGAWRAGSREPVPITPLTESGFAIASVDYRLSPVAKFPAQVHDVKAAIRFLRSRADEYGLDGKRIAVAGSSAGGHLAALVGVTNGHEELEGDIGEHDARSSAVQAAVSFYGASNLQTILSQSTPHGLKVRVPALELLLGGSPSEQPQLARLASPVAHVDENDPPLLLIHGDQDLQMPINQSHELDGAYKRHDRPVEFVVIHGGGHGGEAFYEPAMLEQVAAFLRAHFEKPRIEKPRRP